MEPQNHKFEIVGSRDKDITAKIKALTADGETGILEIKDGLISVTGYCNQLNGSVADKKISSTRKMPLKPELAEIETYVAQVLENCSYAWAAQTWSGKTILIEGEGKSLMLKSLA